jgi:hypothetical protein
MKNLAGLSAVGIIVAFVLAAIRYSGAATFLSSTPGPATLAPLSTVARTYAPTATPSPTDDPAVYAIATIMMGNALATREQGARAANATSTAWAIGQDGTATWSAVGVISASLAMSQTRIAAVQTEIVVRSQIMSATEEYFVSPLRVQATQTAIVAGAQTEAQRGIVGSIMAWVVPIFGALVAVVVFYVAAVIGWRWIDAWLRLHESAADDAEAEVELKRNPLPTAPLAQPAPQVIENYGETPAAASPEEMDRAHKWTVNLHAFGFSAQKLGSMTLLSMGRRGAGVITQDAWERITKFYRPLGIMTIDDKTGGTILNPEWGDWDRWHKELRHGTLPLPPKEPVDCAAATGNTTTPQRPPTLSEA